MFLGTYQTRFSGKGRVILPKKMRAQLKRGGEIVLTRGLDGGIWGFDKKGWEKEARNQLDIPVSEKRGRDLRRVIFSAADEVELDRQGRFVIPIPLQLYANLTADCLLIGAGDHFEIWEPSKWEKVLRTGNTLK